MVVQCIKNRLDEVPESYKFKEEIKEQFGSYSEHDISKGQYYVVYGIVSEKGYKYYLIADDVFGGNHDYPSPYSTFFFDVISDKPSSCWIQKSTTNKEFITSFEEWVQEDLFFERLLDGEDREREIFKKYKAFMDLEYPIPSIKNKIEVLGDNWVLCKECEEVWKNTSSLDMLKCPKCDKLYLNNASS